VTKSVAKENFHDCGRKRGSQRSCDWLHAGKAAHPTTTNQVAFGTLKAGVLPGRVCIEEHDEKRCFDREIVDKLRRFTASWIGQCATGARLTHAFHVGVHPKPIEAQTKAVERPVGVQVAANSICVECDKYDVHELGGD